MDEKSRLNALISLKIVKEEKDALYQELSPRGEVRKFQWALGVLIELVEKRKLTQKQFHERVNEVKAIDPFTLVVIGDRSCLVKRDINS